MLQRPVEVLAKQHQQHLQRAPSPKQSFSLDPVVLGFIQQVVTMSSPSSFNTHANNMPNSSNNLKFESDNAVPHNVWKSKVVSPLVTSPLSYNNKSATPPKRNATKSQQDYHDAPSPKKNQQVHHSPSKKKSKLKQVEPNLSLIHNDDDEDEEPVASDVSTPSNSPSNALAVSQRGNSTPKNSNTARQLHLAVTDASSSPASLLNKKKAPPQQPSWQDDSKSDVSDDSCNSSTGSKSRYKTELCRSWEETGYCRYGEKCQFAHGREELRQVSRHHKYKSELCTNYHYDGTCLYGIRCCFIHGIHKRVMGKAASQNLDLVPVQGSGRLAVFVQICEKGAKEQEDEWFDSVLAECCDPAKNMNDLIIP